MSAQVKYEFGHFRGVKRCEVKRRSPRGDGYDWKPGTIAELSGKGAFVQLDEGPRNFFFFSDMRPLPPDPRPAQVQPPVRGLATIGDAVAFKPAPQPQTAPAVILPPPAASALPAARRVKGIRSHHPTEIGNAFRALRLRERTTQSALAELLGCNYNLWSKIELGDTMPDDALLQRFADFSGQPLDHLRAMRDGKPTPIEPEPAPTPALAQVTSEPEPVNDAEPTESFDDFMDRLCDLAPLPVAKEARKRWLQLARELHALSGA